MLSVKGTTMGNKPAVRFRIEKALGQWSEKATLFKFPRNQELWIPNSVHRFTPDESEINKDYYFGGIKGEIVVQYWFFEKEIKNIINQNQNQD